MPSKELLKYYQYSVGEKVLANVSKVHDGYLIEQGTAFTITAFPPKVRMSDYNDISPRKTKYSRFVTGYTDQGHMVRLLMTEICKIEK